jgi:hypothetical protein
MAKRMSEILQTPESEWVAFPGGELEGQRPQRLCPDCREGLRRASARASPPGGRRRPLCFRCYRLDLDRHRALEAAGAFDTASAGRFQDALPFEPVNQARLSALKAERAAARVVSHQGIGQFAARLRRAQIAARHALQAIVAVPARQQAAGDAREPVFVDAVHAAELQLPESWLPFVVSR